MLKTKTIAVLLLVAMLFTSSIAVAGEKEQVDVYDEQKELVKSVVFIIGVDEYFVDNETPGIKMDAVPFIASGRTFVPIRYLSNALGVENKYIGWESPRVTLSQPGMPVVELAVGKKEIKSNGKKKAIDVAPLLRKGRTYLPARFVAEALGYQVTWDAKNKIVLCWPEGTEKPDVSDVVEYIDDRIPTTPPEEKPADELLKNVRKFSGEQLINPNDYVAYDGWAVPPEFKLPGASIMYMTVEELRQKPVMLGNEDGGHMIFYDVKVTEDRVYVTQADSGNSNFAPARLILAKGNDVSTQRDNTIVKYDKNPFTHGYYVSLEADSGGGTKIEDVTHIMLLYYNQVLAIENPLYKG